MQTTITKTIRVLPMSILAFALGMGAAHASVLDLNIINPVQTGFPGDTFVFQGSITNNAPDPEDETTLFLNFANFDFTNLTIQELLSPQTFTIAPGDTSPVMDLFQITLAPTAPVPQVYTADVFAQDVNNLFGDSVTVTINAVPEPGTMLLLSLGAGLLAGWRRRSS